jgi:hypothetical protein
MIVVDGHSLEGGEAYAGLRVLKSLFKYSQKYIEMRSEKFSDILGNRFEQIHSQLSEIQMKTHLT